MRQPPDLPPAGQQPFRTNVRPAPLWVRFLAGAADSVVAGLLAFAVIMLVLIPEFFPETEAIIHQYADQGGGNVIGNQDLAKTIMENPALQQMLFASQMVLYTIFFLYFLLNEWLLRGSSLGKKIFRITVVPRHVDLPLTLGAMFLRSWLKTVFILLFSPVLWFTFLWALVQKDRRTVHDLIAGTWVID